MSNEFWIGLVASVPVGIVTSLLTLPVQRLLERFSRDRVRNKRVREGNELAAVVYFRKQPEIFTQYILQFVLRIVLSGLMLGSGYLGLVVSRSMPAELTWNPWPVQLERLYQLLAMFLCIYTISIVLPIIRLWPLYRDPEYFKRFSEDVVSNAGEMELHELRNLARKLLPYL